MCALQKDNRLIINLLYHAINFKKIQELAMFLIDSQTMRLQEIPVRCFKRLSENRRRRNLNLLYIIPTFQHFPKKVSNILRLFDRQTKHMPYFLYPLKEPCIILKRFNENCMSRYISHLL